MAVSRGTAVAGWVCLMLAAAACWCGSAAAAGAGGTVPPGFSLQASHGYTVSVFGFDVPQNPLTERTGETDQVLMVIRRPGATAIYETDQRSVSGHHIVATFPGVAEIDVDFRPNGGSGLRKRSCSDETVKYRRGYYEGTIRVTGEGGYAVAEAARAPADFGFLLDIVCSSPFAVEVAPRLPGARLAAGTAGEVTAEGAPDNPQPLISPHVGIGALKNGPDKRTHVEASVEEDLGTMFVIRSISRIYPSGAFHFSPSLATARLAPPPPFAGAGLFRRSAPAARRWTGDLTVDLPGRADVPLTGPQVRAKLQHARLFHEKPHPVD